MARAEKGPSGLRRVHRSNLCSLLTLLSRIVAGGRVKKGSGKARLRSLRATRRQVSRNRRVGTALHRAPQSEPAAERIAAPQFISVDSGDQRAELVRFLRKLTDLVLRQKRSVRIDFRPTLKMAMSGTLLLAAELGRINGLAQARMVSCDYPKDHVVAQVLQHVGIFEMIGPPRGVKVTAENVKYWKVDSGGLVDGESASTAMDGYRSHFSTPEAGSLYRALTEAMTNCKHHAYREPRGDGFPHLEHWWVFSQLLNGRLTVGVCDLGMGIPKSLRRNEAGLLPLIKGVLSKKGLKENDGTLIQAAMEVGATRTQKSHRGKGFRDMRAVLDRLNGTLQVHSDCGVYTYIASGGREHSACFKETKSIRGTLILWQIPLPTQPSTT